jgi:hypothetical protein
MLWILMRMIGTGGWAGAHPIRVGFVCKLHDLCVIEQLVYQR